MRFTLIVSSMLAGSLCLVGEGLAEPAPISLVALRVSFNPDAVRSTAAALAPLSSPVLRFDPPPAAPLSLDDPGAAAQARPTVAVRYSEAYVKRANLHRVASWAMLPLFGAEAIIGQSLYNNPTDGKKTAHLVIGGAIGGLFALNSVTGVWNLIESRHDPEKRGKRILHGVLMLAADAGFLATVMLGPESEHGEIEGSRSLHRAMAFTSISTATVGYLIMLFDPH